MTVMVNEEGGYLGIVGRDGKAKLLLFVEDGLRIEEVKRCLMEYSPMTNYEI